MKVLVIVSTLLLSALAGLFVGARHVYLPIVQTKRSPVGWGANAAQVEALLPVAAQLGAGWFYDWWVRVDVPRLAGAEYVQMVNVRSTGPTQPLDVLVEAARANPGGAWMIGNEIEVANQNGMRPEQYAVVYHNVQQLILDADPTATIASGSLVQWTPLRQAWLERVLIAYWRAYGEIMPVDVWNIHGYVLPEQDNKPVGSDGVPRVWADGMHTSFAQFAEQLVDFRTWLDSVGYGGIPIWVSEFGVLWDTVPAAEVRSFMVSALDWLEWSGVVQRWAWFALHETPLGNAAGALVRNGTLTETGRLFAEVTRG